MRLVMQWRCTGQTTAAVVEVADIVLKLTLHAYQTFNNILSQGFKRDLTLDQAQIKK